MEIIRKLKFLIAAYLSVLFFLLLSVIAMPLVIRQGLSLTHTFVIEEESLETALIVLLFGVSFYILRSFKHTLRAYERAVNRAGMDKSRLMSRLAEAFNYIGAVNVEIKEIESIICGVAHYPQTKREFKQLLDQLGSKVMAVAGAPWVVIRMISRCSGRTVKEHFVEARKGALPSATMGNREILEGRRVDGFRAIGPRQQNLELLTVCILPATPLLEEDVVLITAIANQIEMMFLIYRDGCALALNSPQGCKSRRASPRVRRQGCRRSKLLQALGNAGSGVLRLSRRVKKIAYNRPLPQVHHGLIPQQVLQCVVISIQKRVPQLFAIFFMQHWGSEAANKPCNLKEPFHDSHTGLSFGGQCGRSLKSP